MIHEILLYFSESSGEYIGYLLTHLRLSLQALFLASVIGLPLGYLCYKMDFLKGAITSLIQGLRVIPSLAVLFLLIPLVGIGKVPALIALTLLALPPILINTVLGFSELSPALLEVSLGLGMKSSQLLWRIQLPLALPYILTGIKLALVELIASTTLAAYIGAGGLGNLIITGLGLARMDLLVIGGGSVALLSLVMMLSLDGLIKGVQK